MSLGWGPAGFYHTRKMIPPRPPSLCPVAQGPEGQHSAGRWAHQVPLVWSEASSGEDTAHHSWNSGRTDQEPAGEEALNTVAGGPQHCGVSGAGGTRCVKRPAVPSTMTLTTMTGVRPHHPVLPAGPGPEGLCLWAGQGRRVLLLQIL